MPPHSTLDCSPAVLLPSYIPPSCIQAYLSSRIISDPFCAAEAAVCRTPSEKEARLPRLGDTAENGFVAALARWDLHLGRVEGGGRRKRRAFACIPSVDYPLSLFLGFSPLFMRLLMTLILIPEHFRAKISIEGLFLYIFFSATGHCQSVWQAVGYFAFTVCQKGKMFCQANQSLIFAFGPICRNIFADFWTWVETL